MKQHEEIWKALLPNESESAEDIHLITCEICEGVFGGAQDEIHNILETHKTNEHYDLILRHTFYKRRTEPGADAATYCGWINPDDGKACSLKVGGDPPDFAEAKVVVHQKLSHKTWSREKQFVLPHQ